MAKCESCRFEHGVVADHLGILCSDCRARRACPDCAADVNPHPVGSFLHAHRELRQAALSAAVVTCEELSRLLRRIAG
jgi:hypothetical protein